MNGKLRKGEPGSAIPLDAYGLHEMVIALSGKERRESYLNRPRDRKKAVRG
jgi:hypothetical protein